MPNEYDAFIEELSDKYEGFEDDDLERLRNLFAASPIRKARDEAQAEVVKLRDRVARQVFADVGITLDPAVIRHPDDLDITDVDKVREWAVGAKLVEPLPPSPDEVEAAESVEAVGRMVGAVAGGSATSGLLTPAEVASWPADKIARFRQSHPDAFESLKRGEEVAGVLFS